MTSNLKNSIEYTQKMSVENYWGKKFKAVEIVTINLSIEIKFDIKS